MNNKSVCKRLFSYRNIYLAIYSVESYIFERDLLEKEDQTLLIKLRDKFNVELISDTINKVRKRLEEIVYEGEYFEAKLYLKPKKYNDKKDEVEFRPMHTSSLIDQIAMVSMLNILVYDVDENDNIRISNLGNLLPDNFYGNRISLRPEELFKPWTEQYSKYTDVVNEHEEKYRKNKEYRFEVCLDIKKFFPSVNPLYVYSDFLTYMNYNVDFDLNNMEEIKEKEEKEEYNEKMIKMILFKLLYIKLDDRYVDDEKIHCILINGEKFARGIPQGLPHSFLFGNFYMLNIEKVYEKKINGKMFFYVDDSVIFTNKINEIIYSDSRKNSVDKGFIDRLNNLIENINHAIKELNEAKIKTVGENPSKNISDEKIKDIVEETLNNNFEIKIHDFNKKSQIVDLEDIDENEVYINSISRNASQVSFDISSIYSDNELCISSERLKSYTDIINEELERIGEFNHINMSKKLESSFDEVVDCTSEIDDVEDNEDNSEMDNIKDSAEKYQIEYKRWKNESKKKSYKDRLIRYKKYFSYRYELVNNRDKINIEDIYRSLSKKLDDIEKEITQGEIGKFISYFTEDILGVEISICMNYYGIHKTIGENKDGIFNSRYKILKSRIEKIDKSIMCFPDKYDEKLKKEYENKKLQSYFYKRYIYNYDEESIPSDDFESNLKKISEYIESCCEENLGVFETLEELKNTYKKIKSECIFKEHDKYNKYSTLEENIKCFIPNTVYKTENARLTILDKFYNIEDEYIVKNNSVNNLEVVVSNNTYEDIELSKSKEDSQRNIKSIFKKDKFKSIAGLFIEKYSVVNTKKLNPDDVENFKDSIYFISQNTDEIIRMIFNIAVSEIFGIDLSDSFVINKNTRKDITYRELRLILFIRNKKFKLEEFDRIYRHCKEDDYKNVVDYSIFRVIKMFKTFVSDPVNIDNLVLVHKYTCDAWKNGSKYLYFYTLHNQEHAVDLIENVVKIIAAINYIKISKLDYYVLFIACYLHDISMVTLPSYGEFMENRNTEANKICMDFINEICENKNIIRKSDFAKSILNEYYKKLDNFYENLSRSRHAKQSAEEILKRDDMKFIPDEVREVVSNISKSHGYDAKDVYYLKSDATNSVWSIKFMMILIRVADLLDMSDYRVSKLILSHNLDEMNEESRFHWISHLITKGYSIENRYETEFKNGKNIISENITLKIYVDFIQFTNVESKNCKKIKVNKIGDNGFEIITKESEKNNVGNCNEKCNFMCKWFMRKNKYLVDEIRYLNEYLSNKSNYFDTEIKIEVIGENSDKLDGKLFTYLKKKVENEY